MKLNFVPIRAPLLFALATLVMLLFFGNNASSELKPTQTYNVTGETLEEVWESIEENGFTDEDGTVHAGKADISLKMTWSRNVFFQEIEMPECPNGWGFEAWVTWDVSWSIETTITIPAWPGVDDCGPVNEEWDRFIDALTEHEEGHDQVSQDAFDNASPAPPSGHLETAHHKACDQLAAIQAAEAEEQTWENPNDAQTRLEGIIKQANEDYDDTSEHGAADPPEGSGASLDTSINCDEEDPTPEEALDDLIWEVGLIDHQGTRRALTRMLENAAKQLEKGKPDKAVKELEKFQKHCEKQKGRHLTEEVADYLIGEAQTIIEMLE